MNSQSTSGSDVTSRPGIPNPDKWTTPAVVINLTLSIIRLIVATALPGFVELETIWSPKHLTLIFALNDLRFYDHSTNRPD